MISSKPPLEKRIKGDWTQYNVVLCISNLNYKDYAQKINEFNSQRRLSKILMFFRDHPNRLITNKFKGYDKIIKINNIFYTPSGSSSRPNKDNRVILEVNEYSKINPREHYPEVTQNLIKIIEEDTSVAEKMLIRDIAIKSFHNALEFASNPHLKSLGHENYAFGWCKSPQYHRFAVLSLIEYQFKIAKRISNVTETGTIRNIDLSIPKQCLNPPVQSALLV